MSIEKPVAQKNDVHAVCEGQFQFDKGRTGPCMVKIFCPHCMYRDFSSLMLIYIVEQSMGQFG